MMAARLISSCRLGESFTAACTCCAHRQVVNTTKERKDFRAHLREQADDKAEREAREAAEAARLAAAAGKVKRRSSKIRKLPPRPAAHAVSDVTEFANSTATTDGDKTKWYVPCSWPGS